MKGRTYTEEFKKQAVALAEREGSVLAAARQLGVSDMNIHKWKKKFRAATDPKSHEALEKEIGELRKENANLKKVNTILKAAAAFFSQDQLK